MKAKHSREEQRMKRILTIQDISCFGKCSATVALPVISAMGVECAVIPTAVLSTHTAGFPGFTFRDLTEDIPGITAHWKKVGLTFDGLYTGYLGSPEQAAMIGDFVDEIRPGTFFADPAMADNGKLYPAFDAEYVEAMKSLAFSADIILPNITEACFLTDTDYREEYDEAWIAGLAQKLRSAGAGTVVLTGVGYRPETTGVVVLDDGGLRYYEHRRISKGCHGTGDVYASAFVGALVQGKSAYDAAVIAADYTVACIEATQGDPQHWYGVKFELVLPEYIRMLK